MLQVIYLYREHMPPNPSPTPYICCTMPLVNMSDYRVPGWHSCGCAPLPGRKVYILGDSGHSH